MAGNVVVKINPDRPWIVVSAVENASRNVAVYYDILPFVSFVSSTSRAVNYVLTESEKTEDAYDVYDIVLSNLVIIVRISI